MQHFKEKKIILYFSFVAIPYKCVPSSWLSQIDLCGKCFVIQGRSDRSVMHWRYPTRWVRPPPPLYGSTSTAFQIFSVEGAFQSSRLLFRDAWGTLIGRVVIFAGLKTRSFCCCYNQNIKCEPCVSEVREAMHLNKIARLWTFSVPLLGKYSKKKRL